MTIVIKMVVELQLSHATELEHIYQSVLIDGVKFDPGLLQPEQVLRPPCNF